MLYTAERKRLLEGLMLKNKKSLYFQQKPNFQTTFNESNKNKESQHNKDLLKSPLDEG